MRVTRLKLANVRAIKEAEFHFQPGFNLIVGVNGVGKTSVLDALGVCLSEIVVHTNQLRLRPGSFTVKDVRIGSNALTLECGVALGKSEHTYLVHQPRSTSVARRKGEGKPREQVHKTPVRSEFIGDPPSPASSRETDGRPLVILFSTTRAVPSDKQPTKGRSSGGIAAASAEAWSSRELRIAEFADWMRVQQALRGENPSARKVLAAFERGVKRFLDGYSKLRVQNTDGGHELVINRGTMTIPVRQLSDGERGTLALVLDLTRRLAQANPEMTDPARKAEAIVLIDEIDLHLHPKWQRRIVDNLTAAFPKCQFIATTHSPQVIGELAHERIQIMSEGEVYSPAYSFGVDSSRILAEIMDAPPRATEAAELLADLSRAVADDRFDRAQELVDELADLLGEDDPEVTRAKTLLGFMGGGE
jgi:ABC-type cobalamin/Fe3+-siderophores transport system ATPase subunit